MSATTTTNQPRFTTEGFLGTMVAVLSILTALVAYHSSIIGAAASGHELEGVRALTESNTEYISANQAVWFDYRQFDSWVLATDDDAADYLQSGFSESLMAGMDRAEGPFDEVYYDEQFAVSEDLYGQALNLFEQGGAEGKQSDQLQLVMLVFAVGLSFAAWASLSAVGARTRQSFSLLSIGTLALGLLTYLIVLIA